MLQSIDRSKTPVKDNNKFRSHFDWFTNEDQEDLSLLSNGRVISREGKLDDDDDDDDHPRGPCTRHPSMEACYGCMQKRGRREIELDQPTSDGMKSRRE